MLQHKASEGETLLARRGDETFIIYFRRLRRHAVMVEIDAPGWDISFGIPGDSPASLDSDLTHPPRSG